MSDIPLTKDGGLDPRLTVCRRCGCDTNEIVVGDNRLITNRNGQTAIAPRTHVTRTCRELGWSRSDCQVGMVPEGKLPSKTLCDSCEKETKEFVKVVAAGGIHWRCTDCGLSGVIRKNEFADHVRDAHGLLESPDPCGVEFDECARHTEIGIKAQE